MITKEKLIHVVDLRELLVTPLAEIQAELDRLAATGVTISPARKERLRRRIRAHQRELREDRRLQSLLGPVALTGLGHDATLQVYTPKLKVTPAKASTGGTGLSGTLMPMAWAALLVGAVGVFFMFSSRPFAVDNHQAQLFVADATPVSCEQAQAERSRAALGGNVTSLLTEVDRTARREAISMVSPPNREPPKVTFYKN